MNAQTTNPVHQTCPTCGSTDVDYVDTPGSGQRRSEWTCKAGGQNCSQWTGPDLTMADFEDEDGTGILAQIRQDRVRIFADSYGFGGSVWLTAADAARFALHVATLANQLSADLAGDAEVLAAVGIPVVPAPLDAEAAAEYITVTPSPEMRSAVLAAAGLPDLAARVATPVSADHRIEPPSPGFPTGRKFDTCGHCSREIVWSEFYLIWEHFDSRGLRRECAPDVSTALAAHTAATLDAIGEIR